MKRAVVIIGMLAIAFAVRTKLRTDGERGVKYEATQSPGADNQSDRSQAVATLAPHAAQPNPSRRQGGANPPERELTEQDIQAAAERRFEGEDKDPLWANETEAYLTTEVASRLAPDAQIREITCRAATCRIDIIQPTWDDYLAFTASVLGIDGHPFWMGSKLAMKLTENEQGHYITRTFLFREGQDLNINESQQ